MFLSQPISKNKQSLVTLVLVAVIVLISGCSHRNFIKAGQNHFAKQHFELAVTQFEQALTEKPNHQPTIGQLQQARTALAQWAQQLEIKADHANSAGQPAKAMLLYSKVAQLNQSPHSIEQYKKLHKVIRKQSALRAKLLKNNIGITKDDIANINGLTLVSSGHSAAKLSFKKSIPIFEIQQSSLTKKTQYISGSQMLPNPEFSQIQHQIRHLQDSHHELRDQLSDARHHLNQNNNQLKQLKNSQKNIQQRLVRNDLSTNEQQKIHKKLKQIGSKMQKVEQRVAKSQRHTDKYQHQLSHNRSELSRLIDRLAYTSAVVPAPIYSDYHYQVQHQENSLTTQLYLTEITPNNTSTRIAQVSVSATDESHPEHPTIALDADPMIVKNQQQLTPQLTNEIKQIARRLLQELVDEKRHQFLRLANQTADIDNKFSWWVNHGMVTTDGALPQIAQKIQQTLIMEYGVGGEFNINQLLHRYQ